MPPFILKTLLLLEFLNSLACARTPLGRHLIKHIFMSLSIWPRSEMPYGSTRINTRTRISYILVDVCIMLQTTKEDWFDLTCSGHDPGKGRPGVPYEISRCCFFHLGNVLLDDEITDQRAVNKLSELQRTIERKTQIGKC